LGFIAGLLAFGFMHLPAFAQALGLGQPGQGFIFFHLLQNRCCITRSYLLQRVISKGDTDMNNYSANATAAVIKAKSAVANWEAAVEKATREGTAADVAFCQRGVDACKRQLAEVRESVKNWHEWN
jgi:hypothetical protein